MGRPRNPDRDHVDRIKTYNRSKSQAVYRGELWDLDKETYFKVWGSKWDQRGRSMDSYCMIQITPGEGWTEHNVQIVNRRLFVTVIQKENIQKRKNK